MRVTLSVATSADRFISDRTDRRLILSSPEDWAEVYRLRAEHDAILVGAETLRRDNPSLLIRDDAVRTRRAAAGLTPDIAKVTLTRSGALSPGLRFFTEGECARYVFSGRPIPALEGRATVLADGEPATARKIVTELEKRGIRSLFVEGGAETLRMFLDEGMAATLRVAVSPARVGESGDKRFSFTPPAGTPCICEEIPGMLEVRRYTLRPDRSAEDLPLLRMAVEASRSAPPCATAYRVGAVVVARDGRTFTGYTHEESPTHHAEQAAITKALAAGAELRGSTIYSSMEPCSTRRSEPESCTQLILRHGFARVVFALYEPDCFVCCRGALTLREAGVDVAVYPELGDEVRRINAHLWGR